MLRKIITLSVLLWCTQAVYAQYDVPQEKRISAEEKARRGDKLKGYKIQANTGIPERVNLIDTIAYSSHNLVAPERRSLAVSYAGNQNHPWQSKIFFDRSVATPDLVALSSYQGMLYTPDNVLFYDTKVPLTFVHYRKNFTDNVLEEVLDGTITVNLGKSINLGISAEHTSARGYYANSKSRNLDYRIFGSYTSDRYDLWAYLANDYYKQQENGGIADMSYITDPDKHDSGRVRISSLDIPVVITSPLFNRIRNGHGYLSHRYKLGYYKRLDTKSSKVLPPGQEEIPQDSVIFIPVGSISHQLHYNKASRRMIATQPSELWTTLWGNAVTNEREVPAANGNTTPTKELIPNDITEFKVLRNTLSLSLLEGFRPWVKAGLSAYLRTENSWAYSLDATTRQMAERDKFFSAFVGGELARRSGKGLNFSTRAEFGLLGKDLGALHLEGDIQTKFRFAKKDFGLKVDAQLLNTRPPYFATHNHHTWARENQDFKFVRRFELGAKADLTSFGTWAELRTASLQNHIYWTTDAKAKQNTSLIQMTMLRAGHRYQVGALGWAFEGAYQLSTNEETLPVPQLSLRGDLYIDFMIAKVLQVQLGAEAYWHSAYHAPVYHPVVMQFVNQREKLIGGASPLVNAYLNFRMRTNRFYIRMFNVGEQLFSPSRETMPNYAYNPMHLEAGIVIDLKN